MSNIQIRCTNSSCHFYRNFMSWPEGVPLTVCPICGSSMELAVGMKDIGEEAMDASGHWLVQIADNTEHWIPYAEKAYPSVIAHEYRSLREYCRREEPYAVLLSLKDNFEALLKLEVLLAYAWAAKNTDEAFEAQTVSLLTTPNLSLGAWMELALVLGKGLKKVGAGLPDAIPLEKLRRRYQKAEVVNWRNSKLGHGAMGMSEDEEFRHDIRDKIMLLKSLLLSVDSYLRDQELYLPGEGEGGGEISLTGADRARGLERRSSVYFRTRDRETEFCTDPFIVIRRHEKRGYGTYFFDNQRTCSLTNFLAYAEGSRASESVVYFEVLRRKLELSGVKEEARADDPYLTEEEIRELDLLQMSHGFVMPAHLAEWLIGCLEEHDRGIFLLQMNRGTGKSVFTEKISSLVEKRLKLSDDVDVRTYHIGRTQTAGMGDIRSGIEWQWSRDYAGKTWARAPRISDHEREGKDPGEALCAYLEEALRYGRRNRGIEKVLMVLDGLDEISDENLWKFIPREEMLGEGIYFLLTSRDPGTETLPEETAERLEKLAITEKYCPEKTGVENTAFLREYIKKTGLKGLNEEEVKRMLDLCDHRVLELGLLCRLAEGGMSIDELPDSSRVVSVYLEELEKRYGEKESIRAREMLAVLCTLGSYEGLTLGTLGALTGENGVTLGLIGKVRDLSPMLKTERSEAGNLYMIANPELAEELEKQIPETEDTVRWIVKLTMSVLRDGKLENERELEAAAAHVAELAEKTLPEKMKALGINADEILSDTVNLAEKQMTYLHSRGRVLDYWKQFFIYRKVKFGIEDVDTLKVQSNLASLLEKSGRYEDAIRLSKDVYEKMRRVRGFAHRDTLITQMNVATCLDDLGRYEEALKIDQAVFDISRRVLGIGHPTTLVVQGNMATILWKLDRYEDAFWMYQRVCDRMKKVFGDEHFHTLTAHNNLALVLRDLGRNDEALAMFQEVFEKSKKVKGAENPDTLTVQGNIALVLGELGRKEEALQIHQDVFEKSKIVLGPEHPATLSEQDNLATILYALGRYEKALRMARDVYEKSKKALGEEHPITLHVQELLELIYRGFAFHDKEHEQEQEEYVKRKSIQKSNRILPQLGKISYVGVSKDDAVILVGYDSGYIVLISLLKMEIKGICQCFLSPIKTIEINNDYSYIVVSSGVLIKILSFPDFSVKKEIEISGHNVLETALNGQGTYLFVENGYKNYNSDFGPWYYCELYDTSNYKCVWKSQSHSISLSQRFSKDTKFLFIATVSNIEAYDLINCQSHSFDTEDSNSIPLELLPYKEEFMGLLQERYRYLGNYNKNVHWYRYFSETENAVVTCLTSNKLSNKQKISYTGAEIAECAKHPKLVVATTQTVYVWNLDNFEMEGSITPSL